MGSRYENRTVITETDKSGLYESYLKERGIKRLNHYTTPNFSYPTSTELSRLDIEEYQWKQGDRYYKLAEQFYGDVTYWWVIAKFNNKPTDSHVQLGDVLLIPTPLYKVLNYLRG